MKLATIALLLLPCLACTGPYSDSASVSASVSEDGPVEVRVELVEKRLIPETVPATGELYAEERATIGARAPGRVIRLPVDLGSVVKAGDMLAEIESEEYELRLEQAEALMRQTRARLGILDNETDEVTPEETAIVRRAAAALKEARYIFQTSEALVAEGVISKIEFEKAGVGREAAEASYQAALEEVMQLRAQLGERRAQIALARQNLNDCIIRAPFPGAVTERIASIGEYLPVNGPVATLVRLTPLRLRLEVPERSAVNVRIGQRIDIRVAGAAEGHVGRVVRISPTIESASRSLLVEGEAPNERGLLRPGAFVEAVIIVNPEARGISVERNSVMSFAGVERVFVVSDGKLADRVVRTGRLLDGDRVEILSGLEPTDEVVLDADDRFAPGQPVRVL